MLVQSEMMPLGTQAPDFTLPDELSGELWSLSVDAANQPVVVIFMCNHCPYVVHIIDELVRCAKTYAAENILFVGVNANDAQAYPQDSPEQMTVFAKQHGIHFPYCFDEDQQVAKAYQAACTPDFYLFDQWHRCVYRGRFDGSTPGNETSVTGGDLQHAMDCLLAQEENSFVQLPSMGCNIKWK